MKSLLQYVQEAALRRKDYLSNVNSIAPIIMEHVLLIHMYPDAKEVNHWKGEIVGNLRRLTMKLKTGGNEAKRNILHEYLIDAYYDNFANDMTGLIYSLSLDKSDLILSIEYSKLWEMIKQKVKIMYDTMIEHIVNSDIESLSKYIKNYKA